VTTKVNMNDCTAQPSLTVLSSSGEKLREITLDANVTTGAAKSTICISGVEYVFFIAESYFIIIFVVFPLLSFTILESVGGTCAVGGEVCTEIYLMKTKECQEN
ncbi:MAG: hypothetical protein IKG75_01210, partial [Bacteroidaceae bacterium]|nr:hypothetical protein [Bacteroidaceae bacterium]